MNKNIVNKFFPDKVKEVEKGNCPSCKKPINTQTDFKDTLSLKEYKISGLCQVCQDKIFMG